MRVLCFIDGLGSGGAQRQIVNLAIGLQQHGHEVQMIAYTDDDFYKHRLADRNIPYTVIENRNYLQRITNSRKYLRNADVDAVVSFLETPNFLSCLSAIGKHKWVLVTSERNAKEYEFTNLRGRIMKWFERFSDWTVCNSNVAKQLWNTYYPQYANRVSTIYNPVVITADPVEKKKRDWKRIVIAASYQRLKNPLGLLEALHLLSDAERRQMNIDWYGKAISAENGGVFEEADKLRTSYGLEGCITFHGETKEIYKEMMDADAVALFSEVEGLPNTICEGMMCGKPILMSRMSDYNTFVTPENGFLCDAKDPESIAQAIRKFLALTPEQRQQMGKRSRELAVQLFDAENNVGQWEKLIQSLIDRKRSNA